MYECIESPILVSLRWEGIHVILDLLSTEDNSKMGMDRVVVQKLKMKN